MREWERNLIQGTISKPTVPAKMFVGDQKTVSITIHTPDVPAEGQTTPPIPAQGEKTIRISEFMRVDLTEDENPQAFEIDPKQVCKSVPLGTDTRFTFTVKAVTYGPDQKLTFTPYLLYDEGENDDGKTACDPNNLRVVAIPAASASIAVVAIDLNHTWQQIILSFLKDPKSWFEYILPGGGGFIAFTSLVKWWSKRKSSKTPKNFVEPGPNSPLPRE